MNKRVFTYFDGQMTDEEKRLFENELASSPELRKELDDVKLVSSKVNEMNIHPEMKEYFVNVRARAAMSGDRKRSAHRWQYAFQTLAASVVVLAVYVGVSRINLYNSSHMFPDVTPATEQEYSEVLQDEAPVQNDVESMIPSGQEGDTFVNEVMSDELKLDHKTVSTVVEDLNISTDDMVSGMTANEADNLLASLERESF